MPITGSKQSLGQYYESHRDEDKHELKLSYKGSPEFLDPESREGFRDEVIETTKSDIRYTLNANSIGWDMQRNFMQSFKEIFKNIFDHANNTATCLLKILTLNDADENTTVSFTVEDGNTNIVNREELLGYTTSKKRIKKGKTNKGAGLSILDLIAKGGMGEIGINLVIDTTQGGITYKGTLTMPKELQGDVNETDRSIYESRSITI